MRALWLTLLFAGSCAFAQAPSVARADSCKVITGPPDITDDGRFAVPEPTPEECAAAMALVDKFLATPPKEFRRVVSLEPVPGNVRVHIGRMAPYGGPWNGSALEGDLPNKRHIVTHLSDKIVVVVYESVEYTGPVTSVMIFDRESFKVCNYPRWPFEQDPRRLSIAEIQDQLESGLAADRTFTACHLDTMSLDY